MKLIKVFIPVFLLLGMMGMYSCQETATDQSPLYPENEIPLGTESQEALATFVNALEHFDYGDGEKARPIFEKALEQDPDFVSAQIYRAWTSNSAKDWGENRDKALAMRDKANEAEALLLDMIQADADDDEELVLEVSKKMTEKYPNSARAQENLGFAYDGLDQEEKARECYVKAMELNPDYIPAAQNLGRSYLFTSPKDFKKAEEILSGVAEKVPANAVAQYDLGDCYRAQNDLEKALSYYLKSAELDETNQVSLMKAGHANTFLGNYEAARTNYQDARKRSEHGNAGYNWEAYTYLQEGDHQKALDFLAQVADDVDQMDMPDGVKTNTKMNCMFNCAMIASHYGDVEHLKSVVEKMKPLSNQVASDLGTDNGTLTQNANMKEWDVAILTLEGNYEEALAQAEELKTMLEPLKGNNKYNRYHRAMSLIQEKQGNYDMMLETLGNLNEDNVYVKYKKAKANEMLGNSDEAQKLYDEVFTSNFNNVGYAMVREEVKSKLANP